MKVVHTRRLLTRQWVIDLPLKARYATTAVDGRVCSLLNEAAGSLKRSFSSRATATMDAFHHRMHPVTPHLFHSNAIEGCNEHAITSFRSLRKVGGELARFDEPVSRKQNKRKMETHFIAGGATRWRRTSKAGLIDWLMGWSCSIHPSGGEGYICYFLCLTRWIVSRIGPESLLQPLLGYCRHWLEDVIWYIGFILCIRNTLPCVCAGDKIIPLGDGNWGRKAMFHCTQSILLLMVAGYWTFSCFVY